MKSNKSMVYVFLICGLTLLTSCEKKVNRLRDVQVYNSLTDRQKMVVAVQRGALDEVKRLVEKKGIDVNEKIHGSGSTAIEIVSDVKTAEYLLDKGATLTQAAFVSSVRGFNTKLTELFLTRGANPNWKDTLGNTLIYFPTLMKDKEMLKLLLKHGADPNILCGDRSVLDLANYGQNSDIISILLEHGAKTAEELKAESERRGKEDHEVPGEGND